jgi:hypothetical protein
VTRAAGAERPPRERDREPCLTAPGTDDPVLYADPLRDGEDERPCHFRRGREAVRRLVVAGARSSEPASLSGATM